MFSFMVAALALLLALFAGALLGVRATDVISKSVEIPPHLSLSPGLGLALHPRSSRRGPGTATIDRETAT